MEDIHDLVGLGEAKNLEGEEVEVKPSGIVKDLIANLVSGDYGGGGNIDEGKPEEKSGGMTENGTVKEDNHKELATGGIMNHLISSLVSPRNTPNPNEQFAVERRKSTTSGDLNIAAVKSKDCGTVEEDHHSETETETEGGIINNLISNMFHHQVGRRKEEGSSVEKEDHKADPGRTGLVDGLISNLPIPNLDENAVPGTDEASMLIHPIVHD